MRGDVQQGSDTWSQSNNGVAAKRSQRWNRWHGMFLDGNSWLGSICLGTRHRFYGTVSRRKVKDAFEYLDSQVAPGPSVDVIPGGLV